uniref:Uncharacterized protein n=1 Tax=Rhizophora mucronata TaxID=61149 RepID=A0A2P2N1C7_RHIMU
MPIYTFVFDFLFVVLWLLIVTLLSKEKERSHRIANIGFSCLLM